MIQTWMNIIHSFLVTYTECKRPRAGCGTNYRIMDIVNNLEDFDGDDLLKPDDNGDDEDNGPNKKKANSKPTIYDLKMPLWK